jgi:hypothetical protein
MPYKGVWIMSKENKGPVTADRCPVAECKSPVKRMHFCEEHFFWFKDGLVNKHGEKPTDFDKKFQNYKRKKAA